MPASWSCNTYASNDDEHNEKQCISAHHDSKKDVPSASRPLFYTITMSSGSSGADTFSSMSEPDGFSSSEPSTRAGTPPEIPAAEFRGRSLLSPPTSFAQSISSDFLMIQPALFISPNASRQDYGYDAETESSFSRLVLNSRMLSPLEEPDTTRDQSSIAHSSIWVRRTEAARERAEGKRDSGTGSHSWKGSPGRVFHENGEDDSVSQISKPLLQRSRRPPPLDLSAVSCTQSWLRSNTAVHSPVYEDPSLDTPVRYCLTAPLVKQTDSEMNPDLPHPPATAPFLTMPKAPLIRPSVIVTERSPSPLTLPSPRLSWSLDGASQQTTASTPSVFWSLRSSPESALPRSGKKSMESQRRTSPGNKIATLRVSSADGLIPPSLGNSPFLSQLSFPLAASAFPQDSSVAPFVFDDGVLLPLIGTPFRCHMNAYYSNEQFSPEQLQPHKDRSPPIGHCNPYIATTEIGEVAYAGDVQGTHGEVAL